MTKTNITYLAGRALVMYMKTSGDKRKENDELTVLCMRNFDGYEAALLKLQIKNFAKLCFVR